MTKTGDASSGRHVLTTVSLMVLIGTEIFGVAIAGGWALAGLFELGEYGGYGLMAVFGAFGVYLMMQLWRRATTMDGARR